MENKIKQIALWMADKKGTNLTAFDLRGISSLTESVFLVTARSARHAQALAEELLQHCKDQQWDYFGVEGLQQGQWILVDANEVIVHIFQEEFRSLYNIEGLYTKAPVFDLSAYNGESKP